jgi:hypothetical protein
LKIEENIKIKTFLTTFSKETFHDEVSDILVFEQHRHRLEGYRKLWTWFRDMASFISTEAERWDLL